MDRSGARRARRTLEHDLETDCACADCADSDDKSIVLTPPPRDVEGIRVTRLSRLMRDMIYHDALSEALLRPHLV